MPNSDSNNPQHPSIDFDVQSLPSPSYVIDIGLLEKNCRLLQSIQQHSGCNILLALKGFAAFSTFDIIKQYLKGTTASGLHEALLGYETFGGEVHVYSPAFQKDEIDRLITFADALSFNSVHQWRHYRDTVQAAARNIKCGLRINPEYSEVETEIYNPCARGSRLGITRQQLEGVSLDGITGLHFHTLCEQNADTLERTLQAVEKKFGHLIPKMQWINFGGGHHITRPDYDVDLLCKLIIDFKKRYNVEVYLEPGEAIALNTGYLVATVLDIVHNEVDIAILDTSATAHMPDVLEMPYRPEIIGAGQPQAKPHTYRLGGLTCLAGDVIGDYSFDQPLAIGDKLIFTDMAHYSMVKNTTFNGVPLPSIALYDPQKQSTTVVRRFHYADYRNRLS